MRGRAASEPVASRMARPAVSVEAAGAVPLRRRAPSASARAPSPRPTKIAAAVLKNVAETYSGAEGKRRLEEQHYDPVTIEATAGAGVRTMKFRVGMPLLGITRVFGM